MRAGARETAPRRLPSRLAAILAERTALDAPARRLRLAVVEEALVRHAGDGALRVLDAGCGDGLLTLALARRHPRWSILGVDARADLLRGAAARAEARGLANVAFRHADLTEPLPVGTPFDAVLAVECLSEIEEDERAVRLLAAALTPGGLLLAHVPERSWTPILPGSPRTWREQVRQGYAAEELARLLGAAGLELVELRPTYRAAAAAAQELRDRLKRSPALARALAFPVFAAAAALERRGLGGGRARALLAVARARRTPR